MKKKLITINTVDWFEKSVIKPFGEPWLKGHPEWEMQNITDDSLLAEALANNGPTKEVIRAEMRSY